MHEIFLLLIISAALLCLWWKAGAGLGLAIWGGASLTRASAWVTEEGRAAWSELTSRLLYRDFHSDTIEMADGWLWAGVEILPLATDSWSNADTNLMSVQLNRLVVGLETNVRVQTLTVRRNSVTESIQIYLRQAEGAINETFRALFLGRARQLAQLEAAQQVYTIRKYVLLGVQAKKKVRRTISWRALWSADPWIDNSRAEFEAQRAEVRLVRDTFTGQWKDLRGASRPLTGREVFQMVYRRLNAERAESQPPPASDDQTNPRALLAMTSAEIRDATIVWGRRPHRTISLHALPQRLNARSMERLERSRAINFSFEISAHFRVLNSFDEQEKLETEEKKIDHSLSQARHPNRQEARLGQQVGAVRDVLQAGAEKLVEVGFAVTFAAATEAELEARTKVMLDQMRTINSMEGIADRHAVLGQHLSTLPCHVTTDVRSKRALSRDAMALSGWTGAARGLPPEEATLAFICADGSPYHFNQTSSRFNSGMMLACGGTGTGKSSLMSWLATDHCGQGRDGVILDLNGSYHRLAVARVGEMAHIDVVDPRRAWGRYLFDIYPRPGERYSPDELTEEGLPRDRLEQIVSMLEWMCLDPLAKETSLYPPLRAQLQKGVQRAYENRIGEVPRLDYIRRTLRLMRTPGKERDYGEELSERLAVYAADGPLGHFFNADGEMPATDLPLVVFDFRGANRNPRLMQIATLTVDMYLSRFGRKIHPQGSFFWADELQEMVRYPLLAVAIDSAIRTARKNQMHCGVASQHPEDFEQELLKAVAINCETKWLFQMPPAMAARAFGLTVGQAKLLTRLEMGGSEYRDCALFSPLGAAHLRLRLNAADLRLCAPGTTSGREPATLEAAIEAVGGAASMPPQLYRAFTAERLGRSDQAPESAPAPPVPEPSPAGLVTA